MSYRDQFLRLALGTEIFSIQDGGVKFDPFFGGMTGLLQLAAYACQERMEKLPFYGARTLIAFEHPGYPLLVASALPFQGGDARAFFNANHLDCSRGSFEGREVIIIGTTEAETELHGAAGNLANLGATVVGAVMFFSPGFSQQQNQDIGFPVEHIIREQDILDQIPIDADRGGYLLPG